MPDTYNFPPAPRYDHLTYLRVVPCLVRKRHPRLTSEFFPIYLYKDATGELIVVAEDRFEDLVDQLIECGALASKGGVR